MRFDAKTLKLARAEALKTMTSTLARLTVTRTADGHGGWTESPSEGTATVCRIAPLPTQGGSIERVMGDRVETKTLFRVVAPWGFQAGEGDRLKVDGIAYEIEAARTPSSPDMIVATFDVSRVA